MQRQLHPRDVTSWSLQFQFSRGRLDCNVDESHVRPRDYYTQPLLHPRQILPRYPPLPRSKGQHDVTGYSETRNANNAGEVPATPAGTLILRYRKIDFFPFFFKATPCNMQ